MYKAQINNNLEIDVVTQSHEKKWDICQISDEAYHILKDNASYNASLVSADFANKTFQIHVNGKNYEVKLKDKLDLLLEKMGISDMKAVRINEIVAPMPGLVFDIMVSVGDKVAKGDSVLILEAMKMENVLKAPCDGIVKSIEVSKGIAVEKKQLLVQFE
ncbi:MAG: biotin/lipoyl-containing protein [Chitinophagales bacterium]